MATTKHGEVMTCKHSVFKCNSIRPRVIVRSGRVVPVYCCAAFTSIQSHVRHAASMKLPQHANVPASVASHAALPSARPAALIWCPVMIPAANGSRPLTSGAVHTKLHACTSSRTSRACLAAWRVRQTHVSTPSGGE